MTRRTLLALPIAATARRPLSLDRIKAAILGLNFEDRNELFRWYFGLASTALAFRKKNPRYPLEAHFDIEGWEWDGDL